MTSCQANNYTRQILPVAGNWIFWLQDNIDTKVLRLLVFVLLQDLENSWLGNDCTGDIALLSLEQDDCICLSFPWTSMIIFEYLCDYPAWNICIITWRFECFYFILLFALRQLCIRRYCTWLDSWGLTQPLWLYAMKAPLLSWNKH